MYIFIHMPINYAYLFYFCIVQIIQQNKIYIKQQMSLFQGRRSKIYRQQRQQSKFSQYLTKNLLDKLIKTNSRIQEQIKCKCLLCQKQYTTKIKRVSTYQRLQQSKQTMLIKKNNLKTLLKMLSPNNKKPSFKVLFPEICFYDNGQPQSMFICVKDQIKQIRNKQNLSQLQILNTFIQQNKIYKDMLQQIFEQQIIKYIDLTKQIHQKYVEMVFPPWKPGGSEYEKGPSNLKYHKDDRLLMDRIQQHKDKDTEYVCIVRYFDGNFQLLNQIQFKNLMKNKNQETFIQLIQSYIKPKRQSESLLTSEYSSQRPIQNKYLYDKALLQIQVELAIIPQISELYVTLQSLQQFNQSLKQNPHQYILYQTYKIVHYIQKSIDIHTETLNISWLINDVNLFFINSVNEFTFQSLDYENIKKFNRKQFAKIKQKIKAFDDVQSKLINKWQQKKKQKNLNNISEKKKKYSRSNQIFQLLYPNRNFQDLMSKQLNKFQQQVFYITATTRDSFSRNHQLTRKIKTGNRTKIWCKQTF